MIDIMEQMVLSTDMSKHKEYVADFQVELKCLL